MFILHFHDTNEVRSYKKDVSEEDLIIFEVSGDIDVPEISIQSQGDQVLIASYSDSSLGRKRWIVYEIAQVGDVTSKEFDFVTVLVKK